MVRGLECYDTGGGHPQITQCVNSTLVVCLSILGFQQDYDVLCESAAYAPLSICIIC